MTVRRRPRVAVLWARLSGYFHACLRALDDEADLLVVHKQGEPDAPFDPGAVTAGLRTQDWGGDGPDADALERLLADFEPDAIVVCSWNVAAYRQVCRTRQGRTLRIVAMDNQWRGTPKQWAGVASSRFLLEPTYDAAWVCDERQADFAGRLGYPVERLLWGLYSGDHPRFAAVARARGTALPPPAFLFVGRLVPEKGVDVLAAAYRRYRGLVDDPWPLMISGSGPDQHLLDEVDGVKQLGFVQPADVPDVFAAAGCLVLPSRFEPWAVVIHEAAAAGLPIVCSKACGASARLVLDSYNGVVVTEGDAEALARALLRIHRTDDDERRAMGVASESLAAQYSPEQWSGRLLRRIPELRELVGLPPTPWAG